MIKDYGPKIIKFNQEWDKLKDLSQGCIFTTFRLFTPNNASKYTQWKLNNELIGISLKDTIIGYGKIIGIVKTKLSSLNKSEIRLDTYDHWSIRDFKFLMNSFYGPGDLDLIKLYIRIPSEVF
jgi:hypothetical protein